MRSCPTYAIVSKECVPIIRFPWAVDLLPGCIHPSIRVKDTVSAVVLQALFLFLSEMHHIHSRVPDLTYTLFEVLTDLFVARLVNSSEDPKLICNMKHPAGYLCCCQIQQGEKQITPFALFKRTRFHIYIQN